MHSQCVITSIIDEFHLMITLKQKQVFRNQNLLDVSLPRIILLTKHVSFRVANFRGLIVGFAHLPTLSRAFTIRHICMYNQTYQAFHMRGYLSLLAFTRHKFSCFANSGTPLNFVQRYQPTHQNTKYGV